MAIYETVPEGRIESDQPNRRWILHYLKRFPDKFVTARTIARDCGFRSTGTQVETRKAITELIELDHQPIVSNGKGFAYTDNKKRLIAYHESLVARMVGLDRRLMAVSRIIEEMG